MDNIGYYVKAFIALFVLVNPLEGIPIFLSATEKADRGMRLAIAKRASVTVCITLLLSAFLGDGILQIFGVSIGAFQVGGGAILFLIAIKMVFHTAGSTLGKTAGGQVGLDFAIVPLAIPLLAGPGAIAGAILYGTRVGSAAGIGILAGIIMLVSIATYVSLRAAEALAKYLKETGISVATSIMGLIIAAVAVEMMGNGIAVMLGSSVFKGLSHGL